MGAFAGGVDESNWAYEEENRAVTLIVLTVLAVVWLGYFALWFRERREARPARHDGMLSFNRSLDALGRGAAPVGSIGEGAKPLTDLLEPPRTRQQALRRRRHVAAMLVTLAIVSLLAAPVFGPGSLTVHVLADVGLLVFAFSSVRRQPVPAVSLASVRVLYPDRPAPSDAVAMPLGRVANG